MNASMNATMNASMNATMNANTNIRNISKLFPKVPSTQTFNTNHDNLNPQSLYRSPVPLKPGLDAAGEAVLGVDLVVPHVEQNAQQPLPVLRLRHSSGLRPPLLLRLHRSPVQSLPGFLVRDQAIFNQLVIESPGPGRVAI
ncbi:hypothetical protein EYF80_031156 [Liparis tanakae]|uniref:Uncharacterized protein n=1 Tax=Liparis tanakae TaxID=230148 RepID=A0A4Z2H0P9_9TELE|nr:hypothetical protein EYF80_031156 [Liparis tanakae]